MQIYNTLSKKKEDFIPQNKKVVKMYVCGPTVYNYFHIGNARAFLFFDVVRSYLKFLGYEVVYIQNITDIDDIIIAKAQKDNIDYIKITEKYIQAFFEDIKALNINPADVNPKATDFVSEMIDFISELIEKGYAYEVNGDVYFSVNKFKDYGKLSGKNLEDLQAGARVEAIAQKENPFDFTLWKKAKEDEPFWDSPWGIGRPGWHTECVVMSKKYLGSSFDIHGGGIDLIFPHHENEIAQAEALDGKPLSRYWMHNGFLNIDGDKMSKSLDNFFTARDILKTYDADTVRFFFLSKHYRSPIDYNKDILEESKSALNRFMEVFKKLPVYKEPCFKYIKPDVIEYRYQFLEAMNDDFNTAKALAVLFDLTKLAFVKDDDILNNEAANLLFELGSTLGFFSNIESLLSVKIDDKAEKLVLLLINIRDQAKKEKNYALADKIRNELKEIGIELRDKSNGVTVYELRS